MLAHHSSCYCASLSVIDRRCLVYILTLFWFEQVREERDKESDEAQNDDSDSSNSSSSTTAAVARSIHIVTRLTNTLGETALELLLTAGVATLAQVTTVTLMTLHLCYCYCAHHLVVLLLIAVHVTYVSAISAAYSIICSALTDTAYNEQLQN
jgi:hypothetical protein